MKPTLRPYQAVAVDKAIEAVRNRHRVSVLQASTGAGKTNMACELIGRSASAKEIPVLAVVHRRKLVDQFSERLLEFELQHGVFMRDRPGEREFRIQVASRDTMLSRCVDNQWVGLPPAKLVIVDEGRHAAAPAYRELLSYYEKQGAYIILLDATPVLPDGSGLGPWATAITCAAPVTELIRDGYLLGTKCYAPGRKKTRNGKVRRGIAGDLVESWVQYGENLPTVLFCSRVQYSQEAVAEFKRSGIAAAHVDADTPDDVRDEIFDQLAAGTLKIVSNVGIIKEGVDLPCLGCCQIFMEMNGRVSFLQACGRIMRPHPGQTHGVLIDHAGAVFRHGFPDEDTEWTLDGNVDAEYKKLHDADKTPKALYCSHCELMYHGGPACPDCGRLPVKPPRSIFAAPPVETTNEILVEADRSGDRSVYDRDAKVAHWFRCINVAKSRNGSMGMAAQVYKQKYGEFPPDDFPMIPERWAWKKKVTELYPDFGKRRQKA